MRTRLGLVAASLVMVTLSGGCSQQAPVDEVGLYYSGGMIEGRKFQRVINPGSGSTILGWADEVKWLPAGQRNYIVSKQADEGDRRTSDFIRVPSKGGVLMDFEVSVYFKLNTAVDDIEGYKGGTLRKFWESIGKKYNADSEDGWDEMLNDNFRKIIETSMRQKVFNFTVDELYANLEGEASGKEDAINKIQNEIAAALKDNINTTLGGAYFCGPTFDREKPRECPGFQFIINSAQPADESVVNSFEAQRVAANQIITAENQARAKEAEARGTAAAQNALRGNLSPEYLRLREIEAQMECARNGKICLFGDNSGGAGINLNLPAP